ncbi:hypothetical protein LguiB_035082 [Lonicera macranthoides]
MFTSAGERLKELRTVGTMEISKINDRQFKIRLLCAFSIYGDGSFQNRQYILAWNLRNATLA